MKIKKKDYKKALNDEYWRGVDAGIKYALDNPDGAKRFNGVLLRQQIGSMNEALEKLGAQLAKVFNNGGK